MSTGKKISYWPYWYTTMLILLIVGTLMTCHPWFNFSSMLQLQFASSLSEFRLIIDTSPEPPENLRANTYMDFIFLAAYSSLFYTSLGAISKRIGVLKYKILIAFCCLPGLLDIIENITMLRLLTDNVNGVFKIFYISVRLKWAFVIPWTIIVADLFFYQIIIGINKIYRRLEK